MPQYSKLKNSNLSAFSREIPIPRYDRGALKTGIINLGTSRFERCHAAIFTDEVLSEHTQSGWGICTVGIREEERRASEILASQDGLYTVLVTNPDGILTARIVGSVTETLFAPDDPEKTVAKLVSPDSRIITISALSGWEDPEPVFRILRQVLRKRRDDGLPGVSVLSLDDIPRNGEIIRKQLLDRLQTDDPGLVTWIENEVTFPGCVADRISPETSQKDIENLKAVFSIDDGTPVVTESFVQWIVEDDFRNGRPSWEKAGVLMVKDIRPYEKLKISMVNGGHILLTLLGMLEGLKTVDEAMSLPLIVNLLNRYLDAEVTPLIGTVSGIDLHSYKEQLLQRYENKYIHDPLSRHFNSCALFMATAILPVIRENLGTKGSIKGATLVVAAWCRHIEISGNKGKPSDYIAFLEKHEGFGEILRDERFLSVFQNLMDALRKFGSEITMRYLDQIVPEI